jgi:hypothetical protein
MATFVTMKMFGKYIFGLSNEVKVYIYAPQICPDSATYAEFLKTHFPIITTSD